MSQTTGKFALLSILTCILFGSSALMAEEKPAASVVIPYFEASTSAAGKTTLFSVSNVGAAPAIAHVTLWTSYWQPTLTFDIVLPAHDIATYNVRDILNGTFPATPSLGMTGCSQYPSPAFSDVQRQTLWQDHQGQTCLASDTAGIAVGIITVDLVRQCTPLTTTAYAGGGASTPMSAGYFANNGAGLALNNNVLLSDFHLIDPQENYAQGETAYHLQASASANPAGGDTFYSAFGSAGADNRAPLSSVLYGRFLNGGAFTGGTDLILMRQPQRLRSWTEIECDSSPWSEAENKIDVMVLDESANGFLSERPLMAGTQKVNVRSWQELPTFGALTLRSAEGAAIAGLVLHEASGRFGTGFKLQSLGGDAGDGGLDEIANGFKVDFTSQVNGQQASFDGSCSNGGAPTNDCTLVAWYFGDGTSTTTGAIDTSHTYNQGGTYAVTLVARNALGRHAAATHFITIEGGGGGGPGSGAFTVAFVALQVPGTLSVGFQGSCFLDGQSVACQNPRWNFGDGGASTVISPSHLYLQAGTYPVTFSATHDQETASTTVDVVVEGGGGGPGPTFEVSFTSLQIPGTLAMQFVGTCFLEAVPVPCGNPQWTFGDGGTGNTATVQHTYAAPGTYPVGFTASNGDKTDSATANVTVTAIVPPNNFNVNFTALQVPGTLGVQFVGTCFASALPVACGNPQWTFGDGGTANADTVLHTYPAAGTYSVTFTASHNGETDSATSSVTVTAIIPDSFEVHYTAVQIPETLSVQFVGACFLNGLTVACENPQWTFGDGGTGSTAAVQHTYGSAGTYTVTFTASHNGQSDSVSDQLTVEPIIPEITFEVVFTSTQTPNTLEIVFNGTCLANAVAVACENPQWVFGDGTTGTGASVTHTYGSAGNYTATFTASHNGQTDSHSQVVIVLPVIAPPNNPPTITSLICTPNPVLGGLVSLCVLVVADLDGDSLDFEIDIVGGVGICLRLGENCTTSILGNVTGGIGIPIPFVVATNLLTQTTAVIRAIVTDSHGSSSLPITTTLEVLLNTPPVISLFACVPPVAIGGVPALCSFNLVDLNLGTNLDWKVEVIQGTNVCLGDGPACNRTITGQTNGLLATINFLLRTTSSTSSPVILRATANDGVQTQSVNLSVIVL